MILEELHCFEAPSDKTSGNKEKLYSTEQNINFTEFL